MTVAVISKERASKGTPSQTWLFRVHCGTLAQASPLVTGLTALPLSPNIARDDGGRNRQPDTEEYLPERPAPMTAKGSAGGLGVYDETEEP